MTPLTAEGESLYEVEQERLVREVLRNGRSPAALIPLAEFWQLWEDVPRKGALTRLEQIRRSRRLSDDNRTIVRLLYAEALLRAGDLAGVRSEVEQLDYLQSFFVIGPFDNDGKRGFDEPMPPESIMSEGFDEHASWEGTGHLRRWREPPRGLPSAFIDLSQLMWPQRNVCAYAAKKIDVETARVLTLKIGAAGALRVWWNGTQVLEDATYRGPWPDRHAVQVTARQGPNQLLLKSCVGEGSWGFYVRLTGRAGAGSLEWFQRRAESPSASAADLEAFARYLRYTQSDDQAQELARQVAEKAAKKSLSVGRLLLAAELSRARSDAITFITRASRIAPASSEVLLARARMESTGVQPENALRLLDRIKRSSPEWLDGRALRAELLQDMQLSQTALAQLERAHRETSEAPRWLRMLASAARAAGKQDLAIEYQRRAVAARYDDASSRRVLLRDAMQRQDARRVSEHLGALQELAGTDVDALLYVSRVVEGLGERGIRVEMMGRALAVAPDNPALLRDHGRLLLRLGRDEAASAVLAQVLELQPQDADTRDLLAQIEPRPRVDEKHVVPIKGLRARAVEGAGYPSTILQDLTVTTVYENGLGSTLRQVAAQIHNDQGARHWREFSIQFEPDAQRIELRAARVLRKDGSILEATRRFEQPVGEPWYRIYYDTRELVIVLPELEDSDIVELQWRIDDVSHRNLFHDYFGVLHPLQGFYPTRRRDFVLLSPMSRTFFFNEPEMEGLRHETHTEGANRIDHFFVEEVPPIKPEQWMPGLTEVAPYLHVSTYRTWEEVGRWYWGLIRDQLVADDSLRKTTQALVSDARTTREKVERIHGWVLENTRYVGLEFGIHGYKPYHVSQIVRRGFGDCKDKASLLYAMLKEATIEAHIVLVRTRQNGNVHELPASLAVFDHAITYIPALDLYLDGTAEHSGLDELPSGDQGVMVLHVFPGGASLRTTPVTPAERNRFERDFEVTLSADGSAQLRATEEVRGVEAAESRSMYQAVGTQVDRLERTMSALFPGFEIRSYEFRSLSDLNRPVRLRYQARVPRFAIKQGSTLEVGLSVLSGLAPQMASKSHRQHPLDLESRSLYRERRTVRLPTRARVSELPQGGVVQSPFGKLVVRTDTTTTTVSAVTELELTRDRISADDYPEFRRWIREADRLLRGRIRIEVAR